MKEAAWLPVMAFEWSWRTRQALVWIFRHRFEGRDPWRMRLAVLSELRREWVLLAPGAGDAVLAEIRGTLERYGVEHRL